MTVAAAYSLKRLRRRVSALLLLSGIISRDLIARTKRK